MRAVGGVVGSARTSLVDGGGRRLEQLVLVSTYHHHPSESARLNNIKSLQPATTSRILMLPASLRPSLTLTTQHKAARNFVGQVQVETICTLNYSIHTTCVSIPTSSILNKSIFFYPPTFTCSPSLQLVDTTQPPLPFRHNRFINAAASSLSYSCPPLPCS